jgi:XRE family transcriptional regulator of biofilm formation
MSGMNKNKIREYRLKKGMSLKELADKAEISAGYLCHLEKGTRANPSIKVIEKIANVLGKNISDLFYM